MPEPGDDTNDWPQQATETIVDLVDSVKDKTTRPAAMATRAIVYGIVILSVAIPAIVMLVVGLIHLLNQAIPEGVWLVYLILGSIFSFAGLLLWRKRAV